MGNCYQSKHHTHRPSSPYRCTHFYTTQPQSVSVQHCAGHTSEQLAAHWCMGVALCRRSAGFCRSMPPLCLLNPFVSLSPGLIKQETCSPNNLPPRSPGTTSAFHQHHCFSLLPPHVLLLHGNSHTHPPSSLSHLWIGLPCVYSQGCQRQRHCMWMVHDAVLLYGAQASATYR